MPRPLRKCIPKTTYHCYSRCIEKRDLLSPDFVKEIAVTVINKALEIYDFQLIQVEFVENHFHIIIKTTEKGETISRIMQYIKARITENYNRSINRTGTFWNERFKSKIIEEAENPQSYFLYLMWYIAYNPVRKGVFSDPRNSSYGTIVSYLNENFQTRFPITMHNYFIELGNTFADRVKIFLKYEQIYRAVHSL
jgi:putative transposase